MKQKALAVVFAAALAFSALGGTAVAAPPHGPPPPFACEDTRPHRPAVRFMTRVFWRLEREGRFEGRLAQWRDRWLDRWGGGDCEEEEEEIG